MSEIYDQEREIHAKEHPREDSSTGHLDNVASLMEHKPGRYSDRDLTVLANAVGLALDTDERPEPHLTLIQGGLEEDSAEDSFDPDGPFVRAISKLIDNTVFRGPEDTVA
jgi:hypothetical protein